LKPYRGRRLNVRSRQNQSPAILAQQVDQSGGYATILLHIETHEF